MIDWMFLLAPVFAAIQPFIDSILAPINFILLTFKQDPISFNLEEFIDDIF